MGKDSSPRYLSILLSFVKSMIYGIIVENKKKNVHFIIKLVVKIFRKITYNVVRINKVRFKFFEIFIFFYLNMNILPLKITQFQIIINGISNYSDLSNNLKI